jgi:hypothetical protein
VQGGGGLFDLIAGSFETRNSLHAESPRLESSFWYSDFGVPDE